MQRVDIAIHNGRLIDGTGNTWFKADIGIKDGKIVKLGRLDGIQAEKVIDAKELIVAPGFIDIHNHSDHTLLSNSRAESMVRQGVTTVVVGNCGYSMAPITDVHKDDVKRHLSAFIMSELSWDWHSLGDFMKKLDKEGTGVNTAHLVGHGTVRVSVMGFDDRDPTEVELNEMKGLVAQAMEEGAIGLSTGLGYPPASFAKTSELVELCNIVSKYGGIHATHMRGGVPANLNEAIEISKKAGIPVEISHIGSSTASAPEKDIVIGIIEEARKEGVDITSDIYPYAAGSSYLSSFIPQSLHEGGRDKLIERIRKPEIREQLKEMFEGRDWSRTMLSYLPSKKNKQFEGKNVQEISQKKEVHPVDALCDILIDENAEGMYVSFFGEEDDLYILMRHPTTMYGSDGWALAPYGALGKGKPHPRSYGTFPKVLGRYVPQGVMTLEEAIRKMTSQPAQKIGLRDRGLLREGAWADIVVFDPGKVVDKATFTDPHQYPEGIPHVLVNGTIAVHDGEYTGALVGKVLRHMA